ncbi:MAG: hypothetical protein ACYCPS_01255 [Candidatus Saccharimonadales bacterium]
MGKLHNNENGFSAVEVILVVVIVALIGAVGWLVYKDHHKTSTVNTSNAPAAKPATSTKTTVTTTTPASPYAGWKTYTSTFGFSFHYPSSWTINNDSAIASANTPLVLSVVENGTDINDFHVNVYVQTSSAEAPNPYPVDSNIQRLSNGLRLWTYSQQWNSKDYENGQMFNCAVLRLLASSTNTDPSLSDSNYLNSDASFCNDQNSYTTDTYQQQLTSPEWQDALNIYKSITIQQ